MRVLRGGAGAGWIVLLLTTAAGAAPYQMLEASGAALNEGWSATFLEKLDMPDYWQLDTDPAPFPNGGVNYCVPTAISNSICWFDDHGYDDLVDDTADAKLDQYNLITELAGPDYCNTDPFAGSSVTDYVPGLQDWFDLNSATEFTVSYAGTVYAGDLWTGDLSPDEDWIKEELERCEDVILRVGWYELTANGLERVGGHAVTFVGWDEENGQDIIIHDPWNAGPTDDGYTLSSLWMVPFGSATEEEFMLIDRYGGGYYAIIDGAVAASPVVVPEPSSLALCAAGLALLVRRRRRA